MPTSTPIDYANAYFPNPTLPQIVGQPTFEKLRRLKKALKANAASVQSELGGAAFGHLGLVLDDATYHRLTNNHYVAPPHPGPLVIPAGTAHHEAVRLRDEHREAIQLFRESIDVKNALMKQITMSIEPKFIKELKNPHTDTITQPIYDVLAFLMTRYGHVDSRRLKIEEDKVSTFAWNIIDPPVVIFSLIEDLEIIAEAANNQKSDTQLVNYGLDLVRNTSEFENALLAWYARPDQDRTWAHFKTHFTTAHTELARVRGNSMRGSAFHQANATVEALTAEMHNIRNDLREEMNSLSTFTPPTDIPSEHSSSPTEITPSNNQMNATTQQGQQAIIAAIQQLQQQFNNMNSTINNRITGAQTSSTTTGNRNSGSNNSGNNQRFTRTNISKYCWSHGACAHDSSDCNSKREGHKDGATFENKQGGSTAYCGSRNA
jgi:hypothetical protein